MGPGAVDESALRELISFRLGAEDYCIDIMSVREIRGWAPATSIPHAPAAMLGVVNLRGAILPIVDLAVGLGCPPALPTKQHVIIVVHVQDQTVGLLVDGVNDILAVTSDMIQPPPNLGGAPVTSQVEGIITLDGRLLTLLRLQQVALTPEALAA